jgi:CBS domain containing-hemolysin-like protein
MPADHGDIEPAEKAMIRRIFRFSETTVDQVMVPLIDVAAVEHNATCRETVSLARESAHVRLPVYEGRVDRIVGLLNALELLDTDQEEPIRSYVRPVRFVPESKNISELLLDFRNEGDVAAVVVDEFGGAVGLVTIEDIVEEVVEEIEDEYDTKKQPTQWARRISKKEYVVSARMEIHNAEKELGVQLPRGKYTTLAGLILERAGEIPAQGTTIRVKGISFTIERRTSQSIQEIRIRL